MHGALRPQKQLRLIRNGKWGGGGERFGIFFFNLTPTRYTVTPEWFCSCVSHFNVSLIVWARSQDSVHKPPFFFKERKESRSGSNRNPSAYQPSALHSGTQPKPGPSIALLASPRYHQEFCLLFPAFLVYESPFFFQFSSKVSSLLTARQTVIRAVVYCNRLGLSPRGLTFTCTGWYS